MAINPISSGAFAPSSSPATLLSFFCSIVFRQPETGGRKVRRFGICAVISAETLGNDLGDFHAGGRRLGEAARDAGTVADGEEV